MHVSDGMSDWSPGRKRSLWVLSSTLDERRRGFRLRIMDVEIAFPRVSPLLLSIRVQNHESEVGRDGESSPVNLRPVFVKRFVRT